MVAVALLCLSMAASAASRPAQSSAAALQEALAPRRRAILIGVDRYEDPAFPPLQHAVADAEALAARLRDRAGGFDEVVVLSGADREAVLAALKRARAELRREDELVIYFSGHGTRAGAHRYLLLHDSAARALEETALELEALQDFFSALQPARKTLIVDACFNGEGRSAGPTLADAQAPLPGRSAAGMGPGEAHLFATSPGRPAHESDALGHGVYTYFLLDALSWSFAEADLDGDRVVTAYEAHDHARARTMARTDRTQIPEATFRVVGEGDMVLAGSTDERVRRDRALVYLYPLSSHPLREATVTIDGRSRGTLPGTVPVARGRHHIGLYAPDGTPLAEGHTRLRGGRSYRADDIARIIAGPSGALAVSAEALWLPQLAESLPGGAAGAAVTASRRATDSPRRGLTGALTLGGGAGEGPAGSDAQRPVGWAVAAAGYQGDLRRLRLQALWGLSGVLLPPTASARSPEQTPEEAGWLIGMTGPALSAGVVLSEAWSLSVTGRAHAGRADLDGSGERAWVPAHSLGVRLSLAR